MNRWIGSVALVTGASSGIGLSICRSLVKHGVKVIGCGRNVQQIETLAQESETQNSSGSIFPIKCDLAVESDILKMFAEIRKKFGKIDICINNAGMNSMGSLMDISTESMMNMFKVNVLALCICTREGIKLMQGKDSDEGQIINISSILGTKVVPVDNFSFYTGTKFMVNALTECLRSELRRANSTIKISSICPGMVSTNFSRAMSAGDTEWERATYQSQKILEPEDVACAVLSVLSMPPGADVSQVVLRSAHEPGLV